MSTTSALRHYLYQLCCCHFSVLTVQIRRLRLRICRLARYEANFATLKAGMADMGFTLYLPDEVQVLRFAA